jgi:Protein of unknown function (DUF2889)
MSEPTPVALTPRPLHPRHGIHEPRARLSERRPGSIRRTTTIDTFRPGALAGDAHQFATGRDLITLADGTTRVVAEAQVRTVLDYPDHYRLVSIESVPERAELVRLVDTPISSGFRAAMAAVVPDDVRDATLLHALLDDLPGGALVSGYALGRAGVHPPRKPSAPILQIEGLCAGFQRGGTIMEHVATAGRAPNVTGPVAPPLMDPDDPLAWHGPLRVMQAHDMRRWRRLDVVPGDRPDDPVATEVYFRDSHVDEDGVETVIHEYTVTATIDPFTSRVVDSGAVAHTLPWVECIEAVGSGRRLAGMELAGLRPAVREDFVGVTTCTHLNDTLRSIEDVRALLPLLAAVTG